jgi:hypothetical protein
MTNQTASDDKLRAELEKHIPFSWHSGTCIIWNEPNSTSADCDCPTLHERLDSLVAAVQQLRGEWEAKYRDSEQNRLFSILRHLGVKHNAKDIVRLRREWDASAAQEALRKAQPPTKEAKG